MVIETQDDQIFFVLAGEIEDLRGRLAGRHMIADGKPRLASGESVEVCGGKLCIRESQSERSGEQTCKTSTAARQDFAAART